MFKREAKSLQLY